MAQATQIRVDERRDACADLLTQIVTDLNQVITTRWPADIVADIVGPAGVPIWIKATRDQLGQLYDDRSGALYRVKVDPDTSLPQTKALRESKATNFYQLAKTNPLLDPQHLTQFWISEMYGVDADFILKQPLFNTSESAPMPLGQAVQQFQQLPAANPALPDLSGAFNVPA